MRWYQLAPELRRLFWHEVKDVYHNTRLFQSRAFVQHGYTSVYRHSVAVAYCSCLLAQWFGIRVDWRGMIRAALLHDYFLYDWHIPDATHRWHGFFHPRCALRNALQDVALSPLEQEIILRHMFPLTPIPPLHREGWLVCLADKLCSLRETFRLPASAFDRRAAVLWMKKRRPWMESEVYLEKRIY